MATQSGLLARKTVDRGARQAIVHGVTKSWTKSEQGLEGQEALGTLERGQGRDEAATPREARGLEQEGERFLPKGPGGGGRAGKGAHGAPAREGTTRGATFSQIIDSFHVLHSLAPIPTSKLFHVSMSQQNLSKDSIENRVAGSHEESLIVLMKNCCEPCEETPLFSSEVSEPIMSSQEPESGHRPAGDMCSTRSRSFLRTGWLSRQKPANSSERACQQGNQHQVISRL